MKTRGRHLVTGCVMSGALLAGLSAHGQCASDLDQSGLVGGGDLAVLLGAWGPCASPCIADLDGDETVDGADLSRLLADWGLGGGEDLDGDGIPDACDDRVEIATTIFEIDFEQREAGPYTEAMLDVDWNEPPWSGGVEEGRVSVVTTEDGAGRALAVGYPAGEYGTSETGAQWKLDLEGSYEQVRVSYRLRFVDDFDFVRGGKLPGLIGGAGNTGGGVPTGTDGWSARMMWRTDGVMSQYVYHPDQPQNYGEDFFWEIDGEPARFESDRWYTVTHEIRMNTPGEQDGSIRSRLDGVPALSVDGLRFRDVDDFAIDRLYFSTFFGGGDSSWSTTKDEVVWFDDFVVEVIEPLDQP